MGQRFQFWSQDHTQSQMGLDPICVCKGQARENYHHSE